MINKRKGLIGLCAILIAGMGWVSFSLAEEMVNPPNALNSPLSASGNYLIGPEDVVEISVWKNQDLSLTVAVRPDGMISMPLLGDIQAGGTTPTELQESIRDRLKEYVGDPTVSVIIREIQSQAFFILGEVMRPGKYPFKSETTILQAVSIAGGFSQWAEKDRIIILRKDPGRPEEGRITIRYKQIVSGKDPNANVLLKSGDTVV
ncbi:MAG: polysaccharide biosynthesis/export family protein, partial [Nitrospirae bacterium]|nr:polysaccharide biosynthesis/export family protein [Nitrospirota bacterium]